LSLSVLEAALTWERAGRNLSGKGAQSTIGKTISHYRVLEKLGEGGMGVVYKAKDTHLDRLVAIKLLLAERVADAERKRRFIQEAKAASALNHPNIIVIHEIASDGGCDFIAMECRQSRRCDRSRPGVDRPAGGRSRTIFSGLQGSHS
jgi:serine/threonine protein kinase